MKRRFIIVVILFSALTPVIAQDIQLTQFYASPLYLNPAFTGANADSRFTTTYRNQWAALPGSFRTLFMSYDYYVNELSSGVGILLTSDKAGTAGLGTNTIGFNYAYDYKINRKWSVALGIRSSYGYRALDFDKLLFSDEIARGASASLQTPTPDKVKFLDFSTGLLVFSQKQWAGFALNHINKPNESFLGDDANMPIKGSLHGGANIPLEKSGDGRITDKPYITVAGQYRFEKKFDQVDIGLYYNKPLVFIGMWYRGIPIFKKYKKGYSNNDAISFLIGARYKQLNIGYSYDITISKLTMVSGGSHEISLNYLFTNPKKPKKHRTKIVPCPKF